MVRAIAWKEFREQGLIALMLMVLGAGVLVVAATVAAPPTPNASPTDLIRYLGAGRLATLLLAVTAGMVCGGALFAAEREAGTIGFLESLPASRWQLWVAKLAAGTALATIQVSVVIAVSGALGLLGSTGWTIEVLVYSIQAFAWGMYGSTLARTTLGSVGIAVMAGILATIVCLPLVMILDPNPRTNLPRAEGWALFRILMIGIPVVLSARAFTRADRERRADDVPAPSRLPGPAAVAEAATTEPPVVESRQRPRLGLGALVWLSARQAALPAAVGSGFALLCGLSLLSPASQPVLVWPALALVAGVLAGVTAFADEQGHGTARFWGERRLPIGRAWAVKVLMHALLATWLVLLLLLPLVIRAVVTSGSMLPRGSGFLAGTFRSRLMAELGARGATEGWKYLLVPAAYGFVAGHLCGLLFRKTVVAFGVAGLLGGSAAALWIPSLLAGGVSHWQVWLPPAIALVTARLLMRAWSADRLAVRGPVLTLVAGTAATLVVLAAGIGYRVVEVPDRAGGEDDIQYVNEQIPLDANNTGRDFRTAAERFGRAADAANRATPLDSRVRRPEERLASTLQSGGGWPTSDPELDQWLNRVYDYDRADTPGTLERDWDTVAVAAAGQAIGIYEHPHLVTPTGTPLTLENGRRMAVAVLARGLQRQAAGDPLRFARGLRIALALARNMQNGSILASLGKGNQIEQQALLGTERWLEQLPAGSGPIEHLITRVALAQTLAALRDADTVGPFDPTRHLLAERYVLREQMKAPALWVTGTDKQKLDPEAELLAFAWTVPWERERTRRLLGLGLEAGVPSAQRGLIRGRPGARHVLNLSQIDAFAESDRGIRTHRRAVLLRVAVRAYQTETGAIPRALADLVAAGYLSAVPVDPYDLNGRQFRYRVTEEREAYPAPRPGARIEFSAGQAVLWSVGPNGSDAGGREAPVGIARSGRPDDWVFPVPPPAPPR